MERGANEKELEQGWLIIMNVIIIAMQAIRLPYHGIFVAMLLSKRPANE